MSRLPLVVVLVLAPTIVSAAPPTTFWRGESAGFVIEWTSADLAAKSNGTVLLSFAARAREAWQRASGRTGECNLPGRAQATLSYRLLSVVGPYLSVEESEEWECGGAHGSADTRIRAIDLRKSKDGKLVEVSLRDLFSEAEILKALLADKAVRESMEPDENGQRVRTPKSLAQFWKSMAARNVFVGDCAYDYRPVLLTSFAFHHREGERVAVRISLPYGEEVCRGSVAHLGVWLPVTPGIMGDVQAADARTAGVLMGETAKLKDARTRLEFSIPDEDQRPRRAAGRPK